MEKKDSYVTGPTESRSSSSTGTGGIDWSDPKYGLAVSKWLAARSRPPESPPSKPTEASNTLKGSKNHAPGYTDNDALCGICTCLLNTRLRLEGAEMKVINDTELKFRPKFEVIDRHRFEYKCTTRVAWSATLKSTLFDDKCPLCQELFAAITPSLQTLLDLPPTQEELTVLRYIEWADCGRGEIEVTLNVRGGCLERCGLQDDEGKCVGVSIFLCQEDGMRFTNPGPHLIVHEHY